jgi:hypothetical protein
MKAKKSRRRSNSKTKSVETVKLVTAALRLAEHTPWSQITLGAVAKKAGLSVVQVEKNYASPYHLIGAIAEHLDHEAFETLTSLSGSPHDQIFELLMARFDVMQAHRKGILRLAKECRTNPKLGLVLSKATLDGAYRAAEKLHLKKPSRAIFVGGLAAVYGLSFVAWSRDESLDMAKTMAALDRILRVIDKINRVITKE